MRHHRRVLKRLSAQWGLRLVLRRVRFICEATLESTLRWEILAWIGGRTYGLRFGTGATRREALCAAAHTIARCL